MGIKKEKKMIKKDISVAEFKKRYPQLYRAAYFTAVDNGGRIRSKYVIKGMDATKFRLAENFLLSIKEKKVAEVAFKYKLSRTIPSLEDSPREKCF